MNTYSKLIGFYNPNIQLYTTKQIMWVLYKWVSLKLIKFERELTSEP
jgi:hypothetical protein